MSTSRENAGHLLVTAKARAARTGTARVQRANVGYMQQATILYVYSDHPRSNGYVYKTGRSEAVSESEAITIIMDEWS